MSAERITVSSALIGRAPRRRAINSASSPSRGSLRSERARSRPGWWSSSMKFEFSPQTGFRPGKGSPLGLDTHHRRWRPRNHLVPELQTWAACERQRGRFATLGSTKVPLGSLREQRTIYCVEETHDQKESEGETTDVMQLVAAGLVGKARAKPQPPTHGQPQITRRQRKLARILTVHEPRKPEKPKYPACCDVGPSGTLPTAHFVQGGRPESKRRG